MNSFSQKQINGNLSSFTVELRTRQLSCRVYTIIPVLQKSSTFFGHSKTSLTGFFSITQWVVNKPKKKLLNIYITSCKWFQQKFQNILLSYLYSPSNEIFKKKKPIELGKSSLSIIRTAEWCNYNPWWKSKIRNASSNKKKTWKSSFCYSIKTYGFPANFGYFLVLQIIWCVFYWYFRNGFKPAGIVWFFPSIHSMHRHMIILGILKNRIHRQGRLIEITIE